MSDINASPDPENTASGDETELVEKLEQVAVRMERARDQVRRIIIGQDAIVEQALITLLAGGHALLVGVPGLGKTLLVETLGKVLGLNERRVQFTPDLMPSDILGAEVLEEDENGKRHFRFVRGPVFSQLLMGDEINRASPRTQSALLQAMQEGRVSVAGQYHPLPKPFHVLATQNPIEQEGTYPLPEAQLDRFLTQINITYPGTASEREIMLTTTGAVTLQPEQALSATDLQDAQRLVRFVPVGDSVVEAILALVRGARPESAEQEIVRQHVAWGPGPRASQALMLASRARAVMNGRMSPSVDDVIALALPVLRHRMALSFSARTEGVTLDDIIGQLAEGLQ